MDLTSIIVAALALAGTLAGSWLANRRSAALIAYRLEEQQLLLEEKVKVANHRIEDLETSGGR